MVFFIFSLAAALILTVVILLLLSRSLQVNWERKNRHPASYLMPVVLTVILLYLSLGLTLPCLLDLICLADGSCPLEEIYRAELELTKTTLSSNDKTWHYNPWQFSFSDTGAYRIQYTKRSHFILAVTELNTSNEN